MRNFKIALAALPLLAVLSAPARAQTLVVWGTDSSKQVSSAPDGDFRSVMGGATQGIALRTDGTPVIWGGEGDPVPLPATSALENETFRRRFGMGRSQAILIRTDGTLAAWNPNHLLSQNIPVGRFRNVACANVHAVAIAEEDGSLHAWGLNGFGGVDFDLLNAPAGAFKEVAARVFYTVAIREDGTLMGWGTPPAAMFATWARTPEDPRNFYIEGRKYKAIAAGNTHALAVRTNGAVDGWGVGSGGALDAPAHVRFKAVGAGVGYSVGLATDGMLWGWGAPGPTPLPLPPGTWTFESAGWTRYGDSSHYYIPAERFKWVAGGAFHVMAITAGRSGSED